MSGQKKLLGDRIEQVLHAVRADKVAAAVSKLTNTPCNCNQRKDRINELHLELLRRKAEQQAKAQAQPPAVD
jgi:hypothetical protein